MIKIIYQVFFLNKCSVYKQIPHTEGLLVNVDKNDVHEQITPKCHYTIYTLIFVSHGFFFTTIHIHLVNLSHFLCSRFLV